MKSDADNEYKCKINILLITPYKIIQKSLQTLIEDNRDMCVAGIIGAVDGNLQNINLQNTDVILIYLMDGDLKTVEIIPQLLDNVPEIKVVIVTSAKDIENQTRAVQLGAVGIVQKEQNARVLIEAIRQTYKGETWINQVLLSKLLKGNDSKKRNSGFSSDLKAQAITEREKQVIQIIGRGLKNLDIAKTLNISEATVRHHLSSIYSKTGVSDRLSLVIYAYQRGLITFAGKTLKQESATKEFI